jgi:hypothetical protein
MAALGVFFEHLYSSANGVGERDINLRDSSSAISAVVGHLCSLQERSDDIRDVGALAAHRFIRSPSLRIHDKAGSGSGPLTRYRLISQRTNGLRGYRILIRRNGFTSTIARNNPGCAWTLKVTNRMSLGPWCRVGRAQRGPPIPCHGRSGGPRCVTLRSTHPTRSPPKSLC